MRCAHRKKTDRVLFFYSDKSSTWEPSTHTRSLLLTCNKWLKAANSRRLPHSYIILALSCVFLLLFFFRRRRKIVSKTCMLLTVFVCLFYSFLIYRLRKWTNVFFSFFAAAVKLKLILFKQSTETNKKRAFHKSIHVYIHTLSYVCVCVLLYIFFMEKHGRWKMFLIFFIYFFFKGETCGEIECMCTLFLF
jgi:hypothetical protein